MKTKNIFVLLVSMLWFPLCSQASALPEIPDGCSDAVVAIAKHSARFRGVIYDYPAAGQSTWYYSFTSGKKPAISHVTFALPCPDIRIVQAGMWDGVDFSSRIVNAGKPAPKSGVAATDPTTNVKGLKFDLGFNELATHNYFFTLNNNYAAAPMSVALKAGPGFTLGALCGPAGDCSEDEADAELSSLGDRVWIDANANGIQDDGEESLAGVTVNLQTPAGDHILSTTTDENGKYLFDDLVEGDYRVEFVLPDNSPYFFTLPAQGTDTEKDSDADTVTGLTSLIQLPADTHRRDIDAGVVPTQASLRITKNGTFIPGTLDPWSLCSVFGTAHAFNALIFGSFTADGGDTEGKLGVAGNLTIVNGYSAGYVVIGHAIPEQIGGLTDMLIVGGDFSDGAFGVNGNIVLGGLRTGPVRWMSNGNLIRQVNPIRINSQGNVPSTGEGLTFNELKTHLQVRSTILGTRAPNGIVSQTDDGILLKGEDPDLNVFSLPVTDVTSTRITIDVPADSTVLVNFTAATVEFNRGGIRVLGTSHEKVLLNFPNTSLLRSTSFQLNGSVLAPFADAEFSGGSIEGRAVIGGSVNSQVGFEFHNFEFLGEICLDPLSTSTPPAIAYTFTVENTGNVPLTNVHVVDPLVPVSGSPVSLLPGESDSTTFSAELVLNAELMEESGFSNTAWAYGTVPSGHSISANDTHVLTFPADTTPTPPAESLYPVGNKPDFVMKSLVLPETIATQNQTFSVTVQISNEGDKSGDAGVLRIWPALPQLVPTETDAFVDVAIGHMGIGAVKTLDISSLVASGSYGTIHIRAQIVTATPEYSTGNNHTSDTYFFENPDAPWLKPDFVLRSVNLSPIPGIAGTRFTAVVQIANEGTKAGDAGVLALWAGSSRYANDLTDPDQQISVGTLAVGEVKSFTFENLRAPEGFGTFHTMAIVNHAAATATESAVGNNHLGTTYSLIPVEVQMEAVSEGIKISWNSQSGFYYFVERSTSLTGDFEQIADNLEAVLPIHSYIDTAPPGGLVFYRVWGYKP